jgi:hypothetical protein
MKKSIGMGVLIFVVLLALGYGLWAWGIFGQATLGREQLNVQRKNFEHSKPYVESIDQDMVKDRLEMIREKDSTARKAIEETVVSECAGLDTNQISDPGIVRFIQDCRAGNYDDPTYNGGM